MSERFDYVKYDGISTTQQNSAKELCSALEKYIEAAFVQGRAKSLALTSLEECYMWIGKAIRDEQVSQRGPSEAKSI